MTSKFDPDVHYHTQARPRDRHGVYLKPLDLVRIVSIPAHNFSDPDFGYLENYVGCYGLVTYFAKETWYFDKKDHPGWVSGDGKYACVLTRRIDGDRITSWEFWLSEGDVEKLPYNSLIMNVFADYPWQLTNDDGSSEMFIVEGMEEFAHIRKILEAPYHCLVDAHHKAMEVLQDPSTGQ